MSTVTAFPWATLADVPRSQLEVRALRSAVTGPIERWLDAASALLSLPIERAGPIYLRAAPAVRADGQIAVQLEDESGDRHRLLAPRGLLTAALAHIVDEPDELLDSTRSSDDELSGVAAALALEVAARVGVPLELAQGTAERRDALVVPLRLGPRVALLQLELSPALLAALKGAPRALHSRREFRIRVPLTVARVVVSAAELAGLQNGDLLLLAEPATAAAFPREAWLMPALADAGARVRLLDASHIEWLGLAASPEADAELANALANEAQAPVVHVECGALELTVAEWATLMPGAVVELAQPVGGAAALRVGSTLVARGELAVFAGELAVRLTQAVS